MFPYSDICASGVREPAIEIKDENSQIKPKVIFLYLQFLKILHYPKII